MSNSLSVVLPVHNAQHRLEDLVHDALEVVPDLTHDFEVVLVDDGSTDHTEEVAVDLAREYPQVFVLRHPLSFGIPAAVRTGMERATGEFLFVHQEELALPQDELRRLWMMRHTPSGPRETPRTAKPTSLIERLMSWAAELQSLAIETHLPPGSKLIRRPEPQRTVQVLTPVAGRDRSHKARSIDLPSLPAPSLFARRPATQLVE